jgi:two-component system sensor histidine kinase BaeS
MNNLLTRTIAVAFIAILSFALVTGLVIRVGFQNVLVNDDRRNNETLIRYVEKKLGTVPIPYNADDISRALEDLPVSADFVAVLDPQSETLYLSRKGKIRPMGGMWMMRKQFASMEWHSVPEKGAERFRFAVRTVRADAEQSGQFVISAISQTAAWGALAACVIAAIVAYLVSRPLSRQARTLSSALSEMRRGRRDVVLPREGMKEMREIAASAENLQDTLKKEESVRLQWTADIAHDLRTPLSVLKGQFEGMIDGVLPVDKDRLERNYREIVNLERLVSQLADLTRMESPGYRIHLHEVDAVALLESQSRRFAEEASARGIAIRVEGGPSAATGSVSSSPRVALAADAALLERALANLVENAIRYGAAGSVIFLKIVEGEKDSVSFVVDSAGLIDPEDRSRVFDRLYRGDRSRSTQGSGLGLSIVKAIAEAHGGSVSLECDDEAGRTRFTLTVPANTSCRA